MVWKITSVQDVAEAIQRLPVHEQDLRLQRLKRATDCSLKKSYLPKDLQAVQTPFNFYIDVSFQQPPHPLMHVVSMIAGPIQKCSGQRTNIRLSLLMCKGEDNQFIIQLNEPLLMQEQLEGVKDEMEERRELGTGKPYDRTIP